MAIEYKPLNQNRMKTAVQQIINEFNQELDVAISVANNDKIKTIKHLINIANKYLEMEKEQIKNAYYIGGDNAEDDEWRGRTMVQRNI